MGRLALEDVAVQDVFFATARAAGFPESRIHIHGISDLPLEPIEVVVPIRGITVASPRRVGRVDFLPPHLGHRALDAFRKLPPEFAQEFRAAPAYATVVHTSQRLYDAEVRALEDVDIALAWLCVRARYGLARLPDGHAQAYLRDDARSLPERAELMAVRGLSSGRRWIRDPRELAQHPDLAMDRSAGQLWPPIPPRLSLADRQAILAARQAALKGDHIAQLTAFWEAWEFYAANVQPTPVFSAAELRRLKAELPDWLSNAQRSRAKEALGLTASYPLMRRVRESLENDDVPMRPSEWDVLGRLRRLRNQATHGSSAPAPPEEEFELGLSLLSRALVNRVRNAGNVRSLP